MNIFTMEFAQQEIQFLNAKPFSSGECEVRNVTAHGRLDNFLNVNFIASPMQAPAYFRKGSLWMSMTPMEVQSAFVAIQRAAHYLNPVCGGLGLGYSPLRMAAHPTVERVTVIEESSDCIELFMGSQEGNPLLEKIIIIHGDAREHVAGAEFVYMDVYQTLLPDEVLEDLQTLGPLCGEYLYWGRELALYLASFTEEVDEDDFAAILTPEDGEFFRRYIREGNPDNLRPPNIDDEFCISLTMAEIKNKL